MYNFDDIIFAHHCHSMVYEEHAILTDTKKVL